MNTMIQILLLALLLTPTVIVVYRVHRRAGERVPLVDITHYAVRGLSVPPWLGADTDRIERELFALQFRHRDSD